MPPDGLRRHPPIPARSTRASTGDERRLGIGPARELVLIEGTVHAVTAAADTPAAAGDAFAVKTGFGPREPTERYACCQIRPRRVQVWREVSELAGRDLMRDGGWVTR